VTGSPRVFTMRWHGPGTRRFAEANRRPCPEGSMSLRIVVAEADADHAASLELLITREKGYTVAGRFESAQSLLQAAGEESERDAGEWDLILMNLRLPGADGARTAKQLRDLLPDMPIITYSTLESAETFLREIRTRI
jgi:DNA-binding NarL/FixJ family response regulator